MDRDNTGKTLEQAVGRIQQMLDLDSVVTYREEIINRLGIPREFDVVVRGRLRDSLCWVLSNVKTGLTLVANSQISTIQVR